MDEEKFQRVRAEYKRHTFRKILFILSCIIFMVIAIGVAVTIGGYDISFTRVYEVILDHIKGVEYVKYSKEWYDDYIVWDVRLPRLIFAILAGMGLAVSGATMQSIMRNPLAEPYTTGVSSGAYLGVSIAMVLGFTVIGGSFGLTSNAFLFALIPVVILVLFASKIGDSVATVILVGTALSYLFNAFSMLILVSTDAETMASVYKWQVGTIGSLAWNEVGIIAIVTIVGSMAIMFLSKKLNLLSMGDENAKSLGLNVKRMRIVCMIIMALMVSFIVSFSGIIGFIGLISPHIIRMIIGADNRFVIPAASAFGAAFLLFADTIARYLSSLDSIPVGVVCSFIGAPIFLYILIRNKRGIW